MITIAISKILIILISLFLSYLITKKIFKKIRNKDTKIEKYLKKSQATRKQINNINKHLKIVDASNNLHEVRVHAHKAMELIKKYGLVNEYRNLLRNKTK